MKTKTSELSGAALDWAVAQALLTDEGYRDRGLMVHRIGYGQPMPRFSTDWSQGGPIIEREFIAIEGDPNEWRARLWLDGQDYNTEGPTPLIAAMRCYVASKLGDEVDVPSVAAGLPTGLTAA